ncbi:MAG TPA: hypothetical protein VK961_03315 [Chthoniobacter sp.]|nr:hypothetical protein [Chthoniobacter sp.]
MSLPLRNVLLSHLLNVVEQTPFEAEPWEHVCLSPVFPSDLYPEVIRHLPETRYYGELKHSDARLPSGESARRKLELRPAPLRQLPQAARTFWTEVAAALHSAELQQAFSSRFSAMLRQRFDMPIPEMPLRPVAMLLRDLGGYKISIHSDSLRKAITTQYYLPADESQVHLGTVLHTKEGASGNFEKIKSLPFLPNTGYAFPVAADSWHSVEQMRDTDGERNSLMLIYYVRQGALGEAFLGLKRFLQDARYALPV